MKLAQAQGMLSWVVLILIWQVPFIANLFWGLIIFLAKLAGIPLQLAGMGMDQFKFW
jgi:hypothetical protein